MAAGVQQLPDAADGLSIRRYMDLGGNLFTQPDSELADPHAVNSGRANHSSSMRRSCQAQSRQRFQADRRYDKLAVELRHFLHDPFSCRICFSRNGYRLRQWKPPDYRKQQRSRHLSAKMLVAALIFRYCLDDGLGVVSQYPKSGWPTCVCDFRSCAAHRRLFNVLDSSWIPESNR